MGLWSGSDENLHRGISVKDGYRLFYPSLLGFAGEFETHFEHRGMGGFISPTWQAGCDGANDDGRSSMVCRFGN